MSALMPNAKVANVAVGALSCLFNLFGGYLLPRPAMEGWYQWIQYIMPSSYSLSALVSPQLGTCNDPDVDVGCAVFKDAKGKDISVADWVQKEYAFDPDDMYVYMVALMIFWAVIQTFIFLTLKYVSHLKR